jgi:uncharacterized protein YjiS (DUF1127 family)
MKDSTMSRSPTPLSLSVRRSAPLSLRRVFQAVVHALRLRKSRRDLAALDAHLLSDIGLTPDQARREALRKLWDAPETWQERN